MSTIQTHRDRLNELIAHLGVSKNKFAKMVGTSSAMISKVTTQDINFGVDLLEKIISTFPTLNPFWFLSGVGQMMLEEQATDSPLDSTLIHPSGENRGETSRLEAEEDDSGPLVAVQNTGLLRPRKQEQDESGPMVIVGVASNSATEDQYNWQQYTRRTVEEIRLKTLQDHQNKLNYQLRREDEELFQFKESLEHLGWVFEDAKRIMQKLEVSYSATFFDTKKKMSYDLFKALAIRELKRRMKYSSAIKEFSEAINVFTSKISLDKLQEDFREAVGELDSALAVAEEEAINASIRHPDIEK